MHKRYMFAKKINEGIRSFIIGTRKAVNSVVNAIFNTVETESSKEKTEIKDIYSEMHKPKGLLQVVPPKFNH
ncbi:hypothetical protein LCIT_19970 [Leuconostoc citreum]|uniref:Uncharacterized protein n=1 Tax=Leuconostoc citreum TaxID=33964 RepID=A0A5A5U473_LEUCI|nr:hypothetical protein [Leuconostoc citreum]TDG65406.1 hypothetical protein C5L21_000609 [Leuconostoc citreum]GDZ84755.1 hypothetical protein LCIT_19970 [Leuconostoc citreum]GDZ85419.1 hypothetical protein LCTS_06180 [Leuconostoc citreum]